MPVRVHKAVVRVSARPTSSHGILTAAGKTVSALLLLQLKTTKLRSPGGCDPRTHTGVVRLRAPELFARAFPRLITICYYFA